MSMPAGLADVTSRIAQLQSMLGLQPAATPRPASGTSAGQFSTALADALGVSGTDASAAAAGDTGAKAVALAKTYTGVPYLWGGTNPDKGLDCSGLTQLVYKQLGVTLPRVAEDQAKAGTAVPSLAEARPGDLVFFGSPAHHVGIFVGDGKMIDAPHTGSSVGVHTISGYGPVSGIRRVAPEPAPTGTSTGLVSAQALDAARAQLLAASGLSSGSRTNALTALNALTGAGSPGTSTPAGTNAWEALS
jgi:cell wall-associated NlpC family hydrolase